MKNILDKMASRGVEALSDRELLALLTDDEQLAEVVPVSYTHLTLPTNSLV